MALKKNISLPQELDAEQKLRRSFHLYDRNETMKISKREMVEVSKLKIYVSFGDRSEKKGRGG